MDADPLDARHCQHILEFAYRWHRFGGGSAGDIFIEFGLTEQQYFGRLRRLLDRPHDGTTAVTALRAIRMICDYRLARCDGEQFNLKDLLRAARRLIAIRVQSRQRYVEGAH